MVRPNKETGLKEFDIDWDDGARSEIERGRVILTGRDGGEMVLRGNSQHYRDCRRLLKGMGYRRFKPNAGKSK